MGEEFTFVMLKPDAIIRGIIGEIISRIERFGFTISKIKTIMMTEKQCDERYAHVMDCDFYPDMKRALTHQQVVVMIVSGYNSVKIMRKLIGATDPAVAEIGTIRGDFSSGGCNGINLIHASDSEESAAAEVRRFFVD